MGQHEENQRLRDKYQSAFGDVRAVVATGSIRLGCSPVGLLTTSTTLRSPTSFGWSCARILSERRRWTRCGGVGSGMTTPAVGTSELARQVDEVRTLQRRYAPE